MVRVHELFIGDVFVIGGRTTLNICVAKKNAFICYTLQKNNATGRYYRRRELFSLGFKSQAFIELKSLL